MIKCISSSEKEAGEMIHKNIYSKRMRKTDEVDPYVYDFEGQKIIESFVMFLSKYFDGYVFVTQSLFDFCETKREYISDYTKQILENGWQYQREIFIADIRTLFNDFETDDILDFLDICVSNSKIMFDSRKSNSRIDIIIRPYLPENQQNTFINQMNEIFEHNNLGYYVINKVIETKESDYLHQEVICKSLTLLTSEDFKGPIEEFETAIRNYTKKEYESAIINSCKAFESTMKAILDKQHVEYECDKVNAKDLIRILKDQKIFDAFLDCNIANIRSLLESGLPTVRNKKAGHGDGIDVDEVDRSYASLALNLAGSYIVFLIDRYYEVKE